MFASGRTLGMAEWIIDVTHVLFFLHRTVIKRETLRDFQNLNLIKIRVNHYSYWFVDMVWSMT